MKITFLIQSVPEHREKKKIKQGTQKSQPTIDAVLFLFPP